MKLKGEIYEKITENTYLQKTAKNINEKQKIINK